jgi:HPt (histidine-containing phosphotransfer) domain-containing protein
MEPSKQIDPIQAGLAQADPTQTESNRTDLASALNLLWTRFLPETRERVAILESAAAALATHTLTDSQREAAHAAAHKLAGTLGTFSLASGTVAARELELFYASAPDSALAARLASITAELRSIVESRK